MALRRLPIKKGRPAVLIVLLLAVVILMIMMDRCKHSAPGQRVPQQELSTGSDEVRDGVEVTLAQ